MEKRKTVNEEEPVEVQTQQFSASTVRKPLKEGIKYFIVFCTMGTTNYGVVEDPNIYIKVFKNISGTNIY